MADAPDAKKRTFRKFSYRGVDLDQLLDMNTDELVDLLHARARRRFQRGLKRKPLALIKKLRKAKKSAPSGEKPEAVRTHLRNMIIVPEMIGSVVGVYNGKTFNQVEIKPEMVRARGLGVKGVWCCPPGGVGCWEDARGKRRPPTQPLQLQRHLAHQARQRGAAPPAAAGEVAGTGAVLELGGGAAAAGAAAVSRQHGVGDGRP